MNSNDIMASRMQRILNKLDEELAGDQLGFDVICQNMRVALMRALAEHSRIKSPVKPDRLMDFICSTCSLFYDVPESFMKADNRGQKVVRARWMAQYLQYSLCPVATNESVASFWRKDHSTVNIVVNSLLGRIASDDRLRVEVEFLTARIDEFKQVLKEAI